MASCSACTLENPKAAAAASRPWLRSNNGVGLADALSLPLLLVDDADDALLRIGHSCSDLLAEFRPGAEVGLVENAGWGPTRDAAGRDAWACQAGPLRMRVLGVAGETPHEFCAAVAEISQTFPALPVILVRSELRDSRGGSRC